MKKISVFLLIGTVAVLAMFLTFSLQHGDLRKREKHEWCVWNCSKNYSNGYSSSNTECQSKCQDKQGVSCGKNIQNCCDPDSCESGYISQTCNKRIPVEGCTSA